MSENLQPTCNELATDTISRQVAIEAITAQRGVVDKSVAKRVLAQLPSAEPDRGCIEQIKWERDIAIRQLADLGYGLGEKPRTSGNLISRQAAIKAITKMMPKSYTPDGSHSADEEIFRAQEIFADCIKAIEILPSVQPEILACGEGELNVPDTNAGDMINRQAAIEAITAQSGVVDKSVAKRVLAQLPSAQPKRMRGRWVKDEEASSQHIESIYVCSACNNMEAWGEVEKNTFKFCPNCGADMRGEQDG